MQRTLERPLFGAGRVPGPSLAALSVLAESTAVALRGARLHAAQVVPRTNDEVLGRGAHRSASGGGEIYGGHGREDHQHVHG